MTPQSTRKLITLSALLTTACALALPALAAPAGNAPGAGHAPAAGVAGAGAGRSGAAAPARGRAGTPGNNPTTPAILPISDPTIPADRRVVLEQLNITEVRRSLNANMQAAPAAGPFYSNNLEENVDKWPEGYAAVIKKPRPANASTNLPDMMKMNDGTPVTKDNWEKRKAELYELFDRELYGRVPKNVPKVTWTRTVTVNGNTKSIQYRGHVDNTAYNDWRKDHPEAPALDVNLSATINVPANATGPVPAILVMGGGGGGAPGGGIGGRAGGPGGAGSAAGTRAGGAPPAGGPTPTPAGPGAFLDQDSYILPLADALRGTTSQPLYFAAAPGGGAAPGGAAGGRAGGGFGGGAAAGGGFGGGAGGAGGRAGGPGGPGGAGGGWQQQALAKGWGYGNFSTGYQSDSATSWSGGIIALARKGEKQKPDDWGTLRAWAWGVTQLIDFIESDKDNKEVDPHGLAVEGHSRYGKAACVAAVYEPRLANAMVSSSGEGGAKIYRRNYGEPAESIGGSQEFYWMCGNWQKYCGPLTVDDLPVDAHEFIALRAPKPMFISCGLSEGSELWQDPKGTFLGALNAAPAWDLLGTKGLRTADGIPVKEMPAAQTPLIAGDIAFRQHNQQHVDTPNWPTFIEFCSHYWKSTP